jgi:hypothetical protein
MVPCFSGAIFIRHAKRLTKTTVKVFYSFALNMEQIIVAKRTKEKRAANDT